MRTNANTKCRIQGSKKSRRREKRIEKAERRKGYRISGKEVRRVIQRSVNCSCGVGQVKEEQLL